MEKQQFCVSTLVVLVVICCIHAVDSKYLITTPRVYSTGTVQDVNVNLYHKQNPWNITAFLKITRSDKIISKATDVFKGTSQGVLKIKVPKHVPVRYNEFNNVYLVVEGYEVGSPTSNKFKEKQALSLQKQSISVLIQTDKPIYKPGQTIRMRVVCLTPDLKPSSGQVQRVFIENPSGVRLMQWDKLDLHNGIASLEMPLSKYPVLGNWKIKATHKDKESTKVIEVSKYVLPKFEVVIQPPPFIAIDSKDVSGTVCARYTYGQLVKGKVRITFRLKQSWWWWSSRRNEKKILVEKNITGCYDFTLTNKYLGLAGMKHSYHGAVLNITAVMTEEATGITLTAKSTKTKIVPYRVRLDFNAGTPKHFKPGLPFYGQLRVTSPDEQPIRNETVTITADDDTRSFHFKREFLVNNGIVNFVLPEIPIRAKYLSLNARHGSGQIFGSEYGISRWYSTAGIHCRPWYSKSWSFLALRKLHTALKVGKKALIHFQYTYKGDAFKNDLVYQLVCRGKLAATGKKTISFQTTPATAVVTDTSKPTTQPPTTSPSTVLNNTNATTFTSTTSTTPTPPVQPSTRSSALAELKTANGTIEFLVSQDMVPSCRMLVYYVRKDGETVADSMLLDIEDKLQNQVQVQLSDSVRRPGEQVQITLSAAPGSTVALAAVDKSVRILREADDIDSDEIFDILSAQDVGPSHRYGRKEECAPRYPFWRPPLRRTRSIMPYSRDVYVDASKAFYDTGLVYLSNLTIESRPCPKYNYLWRSRENGPVDGAPVPLFSIGSGLARNNGEISNIGGGGAGGAIPLAKRIPKKKPVSASPTVRKNFPETWLWTERIVSNSTGQTVVTAKVPDTITSWYASAFAMSASSGIGVTDPSILTVFQPFFVSFTLPYSVIRGEQVTLITTVFNYMSQCSTILVSLTTTEHFRLSSSGDQKICICGNEAKSVKYIITPLRLGHIPLKVTIRNVLPSLCQYPSDEAPLGISDAVVRKLLVEPEGVRQEYTYSSFVCPKDSDVVHDEIKISLPKNLVTGSVHATFSTIGDLMGPSLTGLEGLLRLPTGCGEQNMVKFAPNIFIMQYLNSSGQLAGDVQDKAVGFLRTGYQRELTYKRKDGSYSAFGNRDAEGSLWLTAFVLRSFSQASQFIFVDEEEIKSTTKWIESKQMDNGCFRKQGKLFNKALKGGVSTPITLTAYVVISLLESKLDPSSPVIVNALQCIVAQKDAVTDSYSNAIIAFALTLAKHPSRGEFLARLRSKAIYKDKLMYWIKPVKPVKQTEYFWLPPYHRAASTNIEMTSYALMALIGDGRDSTAVADALPIVRWLTKQRNALGGFSSTQDTCVALQALSRYAGYTYTGTMNMRIDVGYTNDPKFHHSFRINNNNKLVLQRAEIPEEILPITVPVDAFGQGCALVQADVAYHVRDVAEKPAFHLSVIVRRRQVETAALAMTSEVGEELCQPLEMLICARWLGEDASGMAVIETKLISGFTADEGTLERLMNRADLGLMKYELEENKVVLYFDEITSTKVCVSFGIVQSSVVKKTKPSSVRVYEYYDIDKSATEMYNIEDDLCVPETEISPSPEIPSVPPASCPLCPKEIDFNISKIQGLVCKSNNVMAVRTVKDGQVRLEFLSTIQEFIKKKVEKKSVRPIEIILPKGCRCSALSPRSKALVLLQEKKIKKKLKRIVLSKSAVVLHRRKKSTIQLSSAFLKCP